MTERRPGVFLTFEGGDGSGKTTQLRLLSERLRASGRDVITTVEPGGTAIGDQIRAVLLHRANTAMSARAELLLYFAARAQNLEEVILPALARGAVVLSDRYTDSTLAYQGAGRSLGRETVLELHRIACAGIWPDLTVVIDLPVSEALSRRHATAHVNRLDAEAVEFHQRVRQGYLDLAAHEPRRVRVVHGEGSPTEVAERVWAAVQHILT